MSVKQLKIEVLIRGICKKCRKPISYIGDIDDIDGGTREYQVQQAEDVLMLHHNCQAENY